MLVRAASESDAERLADGRARAVAACEVRDLEGLVGSIGMPEACYDMGAGVVEAQQLDTALDLHAGVFELLDQDALVIVLREDQHEREGAQLGAHPPEDRAPDAVSGHPE